MKEALHPALEEQAYWGTVGGLTLVLYPRASARRRHALLTLDYGSIDRNFTLATDNRHHFETPAGVAHFLEHRIFEKRYGDISTRFADLGATVDAHTTMTETGYSVSCTDGFDQTLSLLFELVFEPASLTAEGIARERAIIRRELELYQDDVDWVSFFTCLQSLYGDHPIATDIAGTSESIEHIDHQVLARCHQAFYRPERAVLFLFGDFEIESTWQLVGSMVSELNGHNVPRVQTLRPPAVPRPSRSQHVMSVSEPRIALAFHDNSTPEGEALLKRELSLELVMDMLFGPASEFYTREYCDGLIEEESFSWEVQAESGYCFCLVSGDCQEPTILEERVRTEIELASRNDLIAQDWDRAVRKMYGSLVSRFEDGQDCAEMVVAAVRQGCDPFAYLPILSAITVEDVEDALQTALRPDCCGISTVMPAD